MYKIIAVIAFALSGCAAQPSLYELEAEAMVTGDWTQFDRKNKRVLERAAYADLVAVCDLYEMIAVCEIEGARKNCGCQRRP